MTTTVIITSGTSWPGNVPSDWNAGANQIQVIAGGGGGETGSPVNGPGSAGGGAGYSSVTNSNAFIAGVAATCQIGAGGVADADGTDTYLCNSTSNCASIAGSAVQVGAKAGLKGTDNTGGLGGAAASGVAINGSVNTKFSGGTGGAADQVNAYAAAGGGASAGPQGNGLPGGLSNATVTKGASGGGGTGSNASGTAGTDTVNGSDSGFAGGKAQDNTAGGTGGVANNGAGTDGSHGSGGGGGAGQTGGGVTAGKGGVGGNGIDLDASHGAGGGGGGGGAISGSVGSTGGAGGAGGNYGGGAGGGGFANLTGGAGGIGGPGLIYITYTPLTASTFAAAGVGAFSGIGAALAGGSLASSGAGAFNGVSATGTFVQMVGTGAFSGAGLSLANSPAALTGFGAFSAIGQSLNSSPLSAAGIGAAAFVGTPKQAFIFNDGATVPIYAFVSPSAAYYPSTNKLWLFWEGWTGSAPRVAQCRLYDFNTRLKGNVYTIGTSLIGDAHGVPSQRLDYQNYTHCFWGSHLSPLKHAITATPGDPSVWTAQPNITSFYGTGGLSYGRANNNGAGLWLYARFTEDGTHKPLGLIKSTSLNNGVAAWDSGTLLVDYGPNTWVYQSRTIDRGGKIYYVAARADFVAGPDTSWRSDVYAYIQDKTTGDISNYNGSVVTPFASLPINRTVNDASYRIHTSAANTSDNVPDHDFDTNGNWHILFSEGIVGSGVFPVYHMWLNAGTWTAPFALGSLPGESGDFVIMPNPAGAMQAFWCQLNNGFSYDGEVHTANWLAGTWGASSLFLAPPSNKAVATMQIVENGPPNARLYAAEVDQTDADAGAGGLLGWIFDKNGNPLEDGMGNGTSGGLVGSGLSIRLGLGL